MKSTAKKKKRPSKFFVILILTVFIYFFIQSIYARRLNSIQKVDAEYGTIENIINTKAIVVRDEIVIHASISGEVNYLKEEGERVSSTANVVEIIQNINNQRLNSQLEIINNKINEYSAGQQGSLFKSDLDKINQSIQSVLKDIEVNALEGNMAKVGELRTRLEKEIDKKYAIIQNIGIGSRDYEWLIEEKEKLSNQLNENIETLQSKMPGIVCYAVDGYENILIPSNISSFKASTLSNIKPELVKTNIDRVEVGQPVFKIVENHRWYIAFFTDKKTAELISKKSKIEVRKKGDMEIIPFRVYNISEQQDENVIVSLTTSHYHGDFLTERILDVEVIVSKYEGLKLPLSTLTEANGEKGVMVVDFNGLAMFKPVEVIGQNEQYVVIKEGSGNRRDSITLYDKVVLKGKRVKQNQIVGKPVIN
jgi:putative membrane fusion protein